MSGRELASLARAHWMKWLPQKVADLRASGQLNEALQAAAGLAQKEIELLMKQRDIRRTKPGRWRFPCSFCCHPNPARRRKIGNGWNSLKRKQSTGATRPPSVAADRERDSEEFSGLEPEYPKRE
jgi:hypothetical protein